MMLDSGWVRMMGNRSMVVGSGTRVIAEPSLQGFFFACFRIDTGRNR